MHKYIILFFSVTLILSACKQDETPPNIIKRDKMVNLLTDLHILDGNMYNIAQVPDSIQKYGTNGYLALFKRYHTDSAQFRRSYKYYTTQPFEFQAMYDQILDNLTRKTDSLRKRQYRQKNASPL